MVVEPARTENLFLDPRNPNTLGCIEGQYG